MKMKAKTFDHSKNNLWNASGVTQSRKEALMKKNG